MRGLSLVLGSVLIAALVARADGQTVLVYDDGSLGLSSSVATQLGFSVTEVASTGALIDELLLLPPDLVIIENPVGAFGDDAAFILSDFVALGGHAILMYGGLDSGTDGDVLRTAFDVVSAVEYSTPQSLELWDAVHPVFSSPNPLSGPLIPTSDLYTTDGHQLGGIASSEEIGGFAPIPTANQAGIVVGNLGRTIVNGFFPDNYDPATMELLIANEIQFMISAPSGPQFVRGDINDDDSVDISDAVFGLAVLFMPGSSPANCDDASDVNDDGVFDISDNVYLLSNLFASGPNPPAPFPVCGEDPTPDGLGCGSSVGCP